MKTLEIGKIERMKLSDLCPSEHNPRAITTGAFLGLHESIDRFGMVGVIVWNKRSGNIVSGHQRYKVLKNMGVEETDVRVLDMSDQEEKALNITMNNPGIQGHWVQEKLDITLDELKLAMPEAFPALHLDELKLPDIPDMNKETKAEESIEIKEKTASRLGDVWELGKHRLLCGDCTDSSLVVKLMNGNKAVLMATDPPYRSSDEKTGEKLEKFLVAFLTSAQKAGDQPFPAYVWMPSNNYVEFQTAMEKTGYHVHQLILWIKPNFVIGKRNYHPRFELALHGWLRGGGKCPFLGPKNQSDVWEVAQENDKIHPTQKPTKLWITPILNHTKPGDIIYEPFAGSGTAFIAAEETHRICYGFELDPKYVDTIIRRWQKYTGQVATLNGISFDEVELQRCGEKKTEINIAGSEKRARSSNKRSSRKKK